MKAPGLILYFHQTEGSHEVARMRLGADGTVRATVTDPAWKEHVDKLMTQVGSNTLQRPVAPSEGQVFLDAVRDNLVQSTYWSIAEEGAESPAGFHL
jgi:hypothetical protein